jgi:hypothetical protein
MDIYQNLLLLPYGEALNNILRKVGFIDVSDTANFVATIQCVKKIILKRFT